MLRLAFVACVLAVGIAAAIKSRFGALLLYLWFAMFRPIEWLWYDLSAFRLSLVIGALLVIPSLLTGVIPNITHPLSIGSLGFLALSLIAQISAPRPDIGWVWIDYFVRVVVVSLLATTLITSRRKFVLVVWVVGVAWAMHAGKAGLNALLSGGVQYSDGLAGAFSDNNDYALGVVMAIPFMIGAAQNLDRSSVWERWMSRALWVAVPFSALTVVSTMSRGGFLALAAAALAWVWLQQRRFSMLAAGFALLVVALPFAPLPTGYLDRLGTIRDYEETGETSALGRLHFWGVAVNMVQEHPMGVGLKNFEASYDRYNEGPLDFGTARSVHSAHFQVLAELGYAGSFLWFSMLLYAGYLLVRTRRVARADPNTSPERAHFYRTMSAALLSSMAGFVVGGSFLAFFLNDLTWLTFALVASLDRLYRAERSAVAQPMASGTLVTARMPGWASS